MLIRFSLEQQDALLRWTSKHAEAEVNASVEPSGYQIRIDVVPVFGMRATAVMGDRELDLGDVESELTIGTS